MVRRILDVNALIRGREMYAAATDNRGVTAMDLRALLVSPAAAQLRGRGRMPIDLPGWDYYSIWGWDDQEVSLFAQLWRNTDDGGEEPRHWISSVVGWPATGSPEVLAGWIAQVTGSEPRDVLRALARGAPDLVAAELRELAAA